MHVSSKYKFDYVEIRGFQSWLAHNVFRQVYYYNCDATLVGNKGAVSGPPNGVYSVVYAQNSRVRAYNNLLTTSAASRSGVETVTIHGFSLDSCTGEIANNTIVCAVYGTDGWWSSVYMYARGIRSSGGGPIVIKGNAIEAISVRSLGGTADWQNAYAVAGGAEIAEFSYCRLNATHGVSGVTPFQCSFGALGLNGEYQPAIDSPCLNAGPPEPFFNDRDGTRNDMGFTGGPYYQANGATTDKPLLFWLMPAQKQVWKNAQPTLDMEAAATAGH